MDDPNLAFTEDGVQMPSEPTEATLVKLARNPRETGLLPEALIRVPEATEGGRLPANGSHSTR